MIKRLLFLLLVTITATRCAPTRPGPAPAVPTGKAAPLEYRSAFEGYRAFSDDKPVPWRDANEEVKGGGHHK